MSWLLQSYLTEQCFLIKGELFPIEHLEMLGDILGYHNNWWQEGVMKHLTMHSLMTKHHSVTNVDSANFVIQKETKAQKLMNLSYISHFMIEARRNHTQQPHPRLCSL